MKNLFLSLIVIISSVACTKAQKTSFSDLALKERLTALDGAEVTFGDIINQNKGKTVVIECWASWCGDCVKAMPKLKELQASNPDVAYVFISMDKVVDKWKEGIAKHDLKGQHFWVNDKDLMKGSFGKSIDLDWIPRYIVVDKTGKIILYRAIETDFEKINALLKTQK
ncbi:TlpA family protein disulfide reductase [Flavobacterium sp. 3HN19-14]|uniref:TlpA family protein disulfide reductase n=1 Tax=Flavobacterium sp. 3HN19-14 TaxID=3448133 RepID=UPI003EE11C2D